MNERVVTPPRKLDVASAPEVRAELEDHLQRPGARVTVDLGSVEHIDAAGLAVLMAARRRAEVGGGSLRLVRPQSPDAIRIFSLSCLGPAFEFVAKSGAGRD